MYRQYNPNPRGAAVGDCTIRAFAKALNMTWDDVYTCLAVQGFTMADMPSSNSVWSEWLKSKGFTRHVIPNTCPDCYTVADFCRDYDRGTYILALSGHVVTVVDGDYYDAWDSGAEVPIYFWKKEV